LNIQVPSIATSDQHALADGGRGSGLGVHTMAEVYEVAMR
jgi:hypothetical protein